MSGFLGCETGKWGTEQSTFFSLDRSTHEGYGLEMDIGSLSTQTWLSRVGVSGHFALSSPVLSLYVFSLFLLWLQWYGCKDIGEAPGGGASAGRKNGRSQRGRHLALEDGKMVVSSALRSSRWEAAESHSFCCSLQV